MTNLSQICRTAKIRGYAFPGIIHNGNYFLTDLKVFADGLIECWQMVDLRLFKAKLKSGRVVTSIPEGAPINIHGIGILEFRSAEWAHTPKSLIRFLQATIQDLNPRMENLHDCHGRETEVIEGVRYASGNSGNPRPWKSEGPITPLLRGTFGRSVRHFLCIDGTLHLVTLEFFPDDTVVISGGPETITLPFHQLCKQLNEPDIFRLPEPEDHVSIGQLVIL